MPQAITFHACTSTHSHTTIPRTMPASEELVIATLMQLIGRELSHSLVPKHVRSFSGRTLLTGTTPVHCVGNLPSQYPNWYDLLKYRYIVL